MKFGNFRRGELKSFSRLRFPCGKKGMTWEQILLAVIALVVVVLVVLWFRGGGEKAFGQVGEKIDSLGDCDEDGVANMFDKCPCIPVIGEENPNAPGCPKEIAPTPCTKPQTENCNKCGKLKCD